MNAIIVEQDPNIEILTSQQERLIGLVNDIQLCTACELSRTAAQKAVETGALMADPDFINVIFVGMAPAKCEDSTGLPLVGYHELAISRCGMCKQLSKCFGYFLNEVDSYKDKEVKCLYPSGLLEMVSQKEYQERLDGIKNGMLLRDGKFSIRTAGQLLDLWCMASGLVRPSFNEYAYFKGREALTINSLAINTVQCRTFSVEDGGKIVNRPPTEEEMECCKPHVYNFIDLFPQTQVIVALGSQAAHILIEEDVQPVKDTGKTFRYKEDVDIPVVVLPHPSYYLRQLNSTTDITARKLVNSSISHVADLLKGVATKYVSTENLAGIPMKVFPTL